MIVSHKHKFIFVKTEKTAGTSVEIALSKFCGEKDIITPIVAEDEVTRKNLGYLGPQNYSIPFSSYSNRDWIKFVVGSGRLEFFHHVGAAFIRKYLSDETWNSYFKFCFERNPWDKVVSYYYWAHRNEPRPSISEFIQSGNANSIRGFDLYTIRSEIAVDRVFRFENIGGAMEEIREILELPERPALPNAKASYRKDKRGYREILSSDDRQKIARVYAREIAYFGYEW